ncbi:double-strand break repair helicase AddA [Magnetovibrio sp. PR-2]|uniref:double-strand break repair helicase AddA n=1 Tax=Magnetovibrio sp. PR-2 TaxID=3120356 RepID=UPI002FCE436C
MPQNHKTMQRTLGQFAAARPDRSVWVSANAGTGKTRVLVDRIARLLLTGARPEKILCLTFTKTGAAEMAERINAQLGQWAVMDDQALIDDLKALTQSDPDEDMLNTARRLFAQVLDVPGGMKIRTIHAFCESLIGRFPIEAGVAPHFSVIDERTTAELLTQAREHMLRATLKEPQSDLSHAINAMAELVNEDDFTTLMQDLASNRVKLGQVLTHFDKLGGVEAALTALVGLGPHDTSVDAILARADEGLDEETLRAAADALDQGAKTSQQLAANLRAYLIRDNRAAFFQSDYAPLFVTTTGEPRKKLTTKGAEAAAPALAAEQARVVNILDILKARATADATKHLLTVGRAMLDAYARIKRVRADLDYDDLIDIARLLLATDSGVSWVHFKLDQGIRHILVDESQDTSPAQWDIVKRIAEEFFAGVGMEQKLDDGEQPQSRTIFAVGDEKQSIYSFQGADPFEFDRMQDHFQARVTAAGGQFVSMPLTQSFRTTSAVLRVVDDVFAQPEAQDGLSFQGLSVAHQTSRDQEAGLVEIWPTHKPQDTPADDPWDAPLDYVNEERAEKRLAKQIALQIRTWIDNQEILTSQNRPIRAGDVLILVRRRGHFAEEMVRQLKVNDIDVAGADRMVLTEQMAVMDLLAAGRFAVLPQDDLSMAELLKSPLVGFDDDDLFALAHGRPNSLWSALRARKDENPAFQHAFSVLSTLLSRADLMPPYEFFSELLRDGGRNKLTARLGLDAEDPIDEFLGLTLDFERNHTPSLQGFLHWIMASPQIIKRDMETLGDKVRVMTVHGAKGLESEIVFLTDTCSTPDGRQDSKLQWLGGGASVAQGLMWAPHKDARCQVFQDQIDVERLDRAREYRRLLYVAMTRAKERLYVTGFEDKQGRRDGCWYDLILTVLSSIGTEAADIDGEPVWRFETAQRQDIETKADKPSVADLETLPDWALVPPQPESKPPKPLMPSRPEPEAPPALSPFETHRTERFKRGILVHKLLETLPDLDPAQRPDAARQWLARPVHELDDDAQADIFAETFRVLDHPDFAPLFSSDSLAEVSVSGVLGTDVVSARLDRLVVLDTDVLVVDYKTNRPAPTELGAVSEQYVNQMRLYYQLLARIYPQKRIRCLLLWTDGPHILELPGTLLSS